jgi:hypothetical protein
LRLPRFRADVDRRGSFMIRVGPPCPGLARDLIFCPRCCLDICTFATSSPTRAFSLPQHR